jgi:predicted RNA-binding Zn-ribbon protein involved in translation (DUF1610 family)
MKLINILSQHRRDFTGVYECENCGAIEKINGYDDRRFHDKVAPNSKCAQCGKSTIDIGASVQQVKTKYPEGVQV